MDKTMLSIYKTIGQVQSTIAKSSTLDEALEESLKIILNSCKADYAVIFFDDHKGSDVLHPYYWICPIDFTGKAHKVGEGTVGKVYESQTAVRMLDYKKDPSTDKDFENLTISSMIVVPVTNKYEKVGVIQLIKKEGKFTEEEADAVEILALMAGNAIDENEKFTKEWQERKVLLSVRDVTREFQNGDAIAKVLKGVNLNVYEGEFLVLLGESGCGKSTLLNIIGGMDKPTSGEVKFMDQDLSNATDDELTRYRRDNIGFIFQSYNLMPNLNAKENLDLIGELVNDPLDSQKALEMVGLGQKPNSYPNQLSGGQQQRISIARSLIKNPKMILADEPTAALDYETSIVVLEVMEQIAKAGTTLVMVTHNEEITKMADRVVRMRNGQMYEVVVNKHPCAAKDLVW